MTVFSNAGPLMALAKLGQMDLLSALYGSVRIPTAVHQEVVLRGLQRGYADAILVEQALRRSHLTVVEVSQDQLPPDIAALPLDAGEKEAIYLAAHTPENLVLLDDLKAREEAQMRGLTVKGTLGVLVQAYRMELLMQEDLEQLMEAIVAREDIWISASLCREVLRRIKSS